MKHILTTLIFISTILFVYSQEYPKIIEIDGGKYIIMTIDQARKLDRAAEFLDMANELNIEYAQLDSINLRIIDRQDSTIVEQKKLIDKWQELSNNRLNTISTLESQIDLYKKNEESFNKELLNLNKEVEILNRKNKWKNAWIASGTVAGAIVGVLVTFFIMR